MIAKTRFSNNVLILISLVTDKLYLYNLLYLLPLMFMFGRWLPTTLFIYMIFFIFIFDAIFTDKKIQIPSRNLLFIVLVTGLLSFFKSPSISDGLLYFAGTILAPILLFIIITNISLNRELIFKIVNIMIITGIALGFFSIYTAVFELGSFKHRLPSLWLDFNIVAAYFMFLAFFCLSFLINIKAVLWKMFYIVSMLIILFGLFLTQTRGVWISITFTILFYILRKPKAIIPTILLMGAIIYMFFPIIQERFFSIKFFSSDVSSLGRIQAWFASLLMIKDYWLFGAGFDSFIHLRNYYLDFYFVEVPHSHNTYLRLWLELGIFGLIAYLSFFFKALFYTFKLRKIYKDKYYKALMEGLQMSLIGLIIAFMFEPYFSLYGNSTIIIWLFISIIFNLNEFNKKTNNLYT